MSTKIKVWSKGFEEGGGRKNRLRVECELARRDTGRARRREWEAGKKGRRKEAIRRGVVRGRKPGTASGPGCAGGEVNKRTRRTVAVLEEARVEGGEKADQKGHWVVEKITQVKKWKSKFNFEALVNWRGVDPSSGEA